MISVEGIVWVEGIAESEGWGRKGIQVPELSPRNILNGLVFGVEKQKSVVSSRVERAGLKCFSKDNES